MMIPRVIPCLLLQDTGLVKTVNFSKPKYVGDPINAVRIFNDKEVDEIVFLDISASRQSRDPNYSLIEHIATEAFMPFAYGGGIHTLDHAKKLFDLGVEKIILNSVFHKNPEVVERLANEYGNQAIVVCLDIKKNMLGKKTVRYLNGKINVKQSVLECAKKAVSLGVGEIIINSIDHDGCQTGYDTAIIAEVAKQTSIPIVGLGGARDLEDILSVINAGASAAAAGSMFVFHGKHRAVLITYPEYSELEELFK